jgi:DNA-binding NarL/FixJ family response regulator
MRSVLRLVFDLDARYEVVGEAADGQEAITAAELLQPDVIILDWEMPGLNGFEALPAIKQNARSALVVVVYSAHLPGNAAERAVAAGAAAFIEKTEAPQIVVETVSVLLGQSA